MAFIEPGKANAYSLVAEPDFAQKELSGDGAEMAAVGAGLIVGPEIHS